MRALVASIVDPGSSRGGAWTSTRGLLELLRRAGVDLEVVHAEERRRAGVAHEARQLAALLRSTVSRLPAKPSFARSRRLRDDVLARIRRAPPDLVVVNGGDLLWLLDELPRGTRSLVVAHNLEHRLYRDQVRRLRVPLGPARTALLRDARRLRAFELDRLARAGRAIFLSSADAARACRALPDLDAVVVPPVFGDGVPAHTPRADRSRLELLMVANLDWWPNRLGLEWLRREVLARLGGEVRLQLVGLGTEQAAAGGDERVVGHGYVPTLDRALGDADIAIVPSVAGGGVSVKSAEMAYRGMPLLVRPRALRGLPLRADGATVALGEAAEWVAFLRSEAASRLAATAPPAERAAPFTLAPYVETVAALVERAARGAPLRPLRST